MLGLSDYASTLFDVMGGNVAQIFTLPSTPITYPFIDQGGFKDMHVKEEEKWDVFLNQLSGNRKLSKDEKVLLKKNSTSHKKEKTLLVLLVSAIAISFLFTLFSILKNTFLEPEYVPLDEFERKLEQVRLQHRQENDRLGKELKEAKVIIDSLRSESRK